MKYYRHVDGMALPTLEAAQELGWMLLYERSISREDTLVVASICSAYARLIEATPEDRAAIVAQLQAPEPQP